MLMRSNGIRRAGYCVNVVAASILYWRIGNERKHAECCRDLFTLRRRHYILQGARITRRLFLGVPKMRSPKNLRAFGSFYTEGVGQEVLRPTSVDTFARLRFQAFCSFLKRVRQKIKGQPKPPLTVEYSPGFMLQPAMPAVRR
jgi:hypothetical protein